LHVLRLLRSLAQDRDGDSQQRSSFELRQISRDYLKLRIRGGYTWSQVEGLGDKRRSIAAALLPFLVAKLPAGTRGKDLLVNTTFGELQQLLEGDLELNATIKPQHRQKALEHTLLYLHQQEVLVLNHGMTVMRRAMTIDINPEKQGQRYLKDDYQRLDEHYRERRIQVHVMREYAERALREMADALRLVMHYFTRTSDDFLRRYFAGKDDILRLATSEASWKQIVDALNPPQREIVTDHHDCNRLARRPRVGQDPRRRAPHRLPAAGAARAGVGHHRPHLQPARGQRDPPAPPGPGWQRCHRPYRADLSRHGDASPAANKPHPATRWKRRARRIARSAQPICRRAAPWSMARTICANGCCGAIATS
jgi:hypothetical protein